MSGASEARLGPGLPKSQGRGTVTALQWRSALPHARPGWAETPGIARRRVRRSHGRDGIPDPAPITGAPRRRAAPRSVSLSQQ